VEGQVFYKTTWGSLHGRTQVVFLLSMTKEEVLQALRSSREVSVMDDTSNWKKAFELYNVAKGTKMKAGDRCSKCYQKVLDWLQDVK
jgi:hypothetical protein